MQDEGTVQPVGMPIRRRTVLKASVATGGAVAVAPLLAATSLGPTEGSESTLAPAQASMAVVLKVNGNDHRLALDPRTTLLDALREHLQNIE